MSDLQTTIDTHLEAYGEDDADRRAELVARVWSDDGQLIDPPIDAAGHAGIVDVAGALQGMYPGHTFRRTSGIDTHHGFARYEWELLSPEGTIALAGLDVAEVADDGRLRRIVGFLGPIPADG